MKHLLTLLHERRLLVVCLLCMAPLCLTLYAWHTTAGKVIEAQQIAFNTLTKESEKALLYRMQSYKNALIGGLGFYEGSNHVSLEEWRAYVDAIDVRKNFPGLNGIGTIYDVAHTDLPTFIEDARAQDYPDFTVRPEGNFSDHFVIKFIAPYNINKQAVGLNTAFEANRKQAAVLSRDTGEAAITKRILLVQDTEKTPGFLFFLPFYDSKKPQSTAEERRAAFKHWIYAPFIGKNFMYHLTDSQGETVHLKVYDGATSDNETLIYDSNPDTFQHTEPAFVFRKTITMMQQEWTVEWSSLPEFERLTKSYEPQLILVSGLLFTGLFGIFALITTSRTHQQRHLEYYIFPLLAFFITAAAALYLYRETVVKERDFINETVSEAMQSVSSTIQNSISTQITALRRMSDRWEAGGGTPYDQWQKDAEHYVRDIPGLVAVEWADHTYHVKWIEPLQGNEKKEDPLTPFVDERDKALKRKAEVDHITVTPPLDTPQGYKAFITYAPIYIDSVFTGFTVGIFDIKETMDAAVSDSNIENYVFNISYNKKIFYSSEPEFTAINGVTQTSTIMIGDKVWTLTFSPKPAFINKHSSNLPETILAVGFLLSIMTSFIINYAQRHKEKTHELQEKENLLSLFVKYTPAAVAMLDKKLNYIAASDKWINDYKIDDPDIIGKNHLDIFCDILSENKANPRDDYNKVLAGKILQVDESEFINRDNETEWIRYEVHPWSNADGVIGGIVIFSENITVRKRVEIMKNEFVSTVSHELRTPLTSIQGSLALLQMKTKDILETKSRRLLDLSYNNCTRLAMLVNDILDIEKIAAGRMEYFIQPTDMGLVVADIVERHNAFADKYNITFVTDIEEGHIYCDVDPDRFNQALVNLLSNAAKFSYPGGTVRIAAHTNGTRQLTVSVTDEGQGVPKEFQPKLFDKFAQADSSSVREKGGTGLGLSITKSIIEAFNGEVTFDSEPGKGSTFYFLLPLTSLTATEAV